MRPNKQEKLNFINKCGCKVDYDLLRKAALWFADGNMHSKKSIHLKNGYPHISLLSKQISVHRLLGMYLWGNDMTSKTEVRYKDGDKLNLLPENLYLSASHAEKFQTKTLRQKVMAMKWLQ